MPDSGSPKLIHAPGRKRRSRKPIQLHAKEIASNITFNEVTLGIEEASASFLPSGS
jgi:hypothetical protein